MRWPRVNPPPTSLRSLRRATGRGVVFNQHNEGMATRSQFDTSVNNAIVNGSRQTATVGGNPAMQPA